MSKIQSIIMVAIAFILTGFSISLYLLAGFGPDAISVFTQGLSTIFNISVGVAGFCLYFTVILITLFIDKHYLGLSTIMSLVIVGPSIDLFMMLFSPIVTPEASIAIRLLFFLIAYIGLSFAIALYLSANIGISSADLIPIMFSDKVHLQFRWCKVAFDLFMVISGIALGGAFGWGTIFAAFATGPTIQFFRSKIEQKLGTASALNKKINKLL